MHSKYAITVIYMYMTINANVRLLIRILIIAKKQLKKKNALSGNANL